MVRLRVAASSPPRLRRLLAAALVIVLAPACGRRLEYAIDLPVTGQSILTVNELGFAIDPATPDVRPPDLVDWDGAPLRLAVVAVDLERVDLPVGPIAEPRATAVVLSDYLGNDVTSYVREVTTESLGAWAPQPTLAPALAKLELERDIPCDGSRVVVRTSTIHGASIETLTVTRDGTVVVGGHFEEREVRSAMIGVVEESAMHLRPLDLDEGEVRDLDTDGELVWAVVTPHDRLDPRMWILTLDAQTNIRSMRALERRTEELPEGLRALPGGRALFYSKARVLELTESSSTARDVSSSYPSDLIALGDELAITDDSAVHRRAGTRWSRDPGALPGARGLREAGGRLLVWSAVDVAVRDSDAAWTTLPTEGPTVRKLGALPLALDRVMLAGDSGFLAIYDPVSAWCDLMTGRTRWLQGLTQIDATRFVAFDDFFRNPASMTVEQSEVYWISL